MKIHKKVFINLLAGILTTTSLAVTTTNIRLVFITKRVRKSILILKLMGCLKKVLQ